jgi:hypothetical protein
LLSRTRDVVPQVPRRCLLRIPNAAAQVPGRSCAGAETPWCKWTDAVAQVSDAAAQVLRRSGSGALKLLSKYNNSVAHVNPLSSALAPMLLLSCPNATARGLTLLRRFPYASAQVTRRLCA